MSESPTTMTTAAALAGGTDASTSLGAALQGTDPSVLQQMLLLSRQVNKLKHSLDLSTASANSDHSSHHLPSSRRNSMPLKKRLKSSGSFSGTTDSSLATTSGTTTLGLAASLSPSTLARPTSLALTAAAVAATAPAGPAISTSSLASLTALLGKKIPDTQDIATRLEAFREAQRRSKASRELLALATKELKGGGGKTSPTTAAAATTTTPTLAAALSPLDPPGSTTALTLASLTSTLRRHSLSSLGAATAGTCSRSGSLGATATTGTSAFGQTLTSW